MSVYFKVPLVPVIKVIKSKTTRFSPNKFKNLLGPKGTDADTKMQWAVY